MSEANNLIDESHIVPCFSNGEWNYSGFVSPFPQFNNRSMDTANANEYSSLITGSYGQIQEYPIQGSSTELSQDSGAYKSEYHTSQNKGRWKNRLVPPLANVRCYLPDIFTSECETSVAPSDMSRYDRCRSW